MSVREQAINMVNTLDERDLEELIAFIRDGLTAVNDGWDNIEEDEPLPDEIAIFAAYHANGGELTTEQYNEVMSRVHKE